MENTAQQTEPVFDDDMRTILTERAKEIDKNPPQWATLDDLKKALAEI